MILTEVALLLFMMFIHILMTAGFEPLSLGVLWICVLQFLLGRVSKQHQGASCFILG